MKLAIITGGSRGLGKSLVNVFCVKGFDLVSIARGEKALNHKKILKHIRQDISDLDKIQKLFKQIEEIISQKAYDEIVLINNAGIIGDIKRVGNLKKEAISKTINTNLVAPIYISSEFLKLIKKDIKVRILNISSGAGIKPYYGWSLYCSSKAGMEMFSKVLAKEAARNNNFKTICIKPGIIDTDMQFQIRNSKEVDFEDVNRFRELKSDNKLYSPDFAASKIFDLYKLDKYISGDSIDVRDI